MVWAGYLSICVGLWGFFGASHGHQIVSLGLPSPTLAFLEYVFPCACVCVSVYVFVCGGGGVFVRACMLTRARV
jgi:hypothetical protein